MRNERLAVQQRLSDVYLNHLASLQHELTSFWKQRQAATQFGVDGSASEIFASIVRSNLADSIVVYDRTGRAAYPSSAGEPQNQFEEKGEWATARELEFQKTNYLAAAEAYGRIAQASQDIHAKARALQSQAGCLLKIDRRDEALKHFLELADNASLRDAVSAQGSLIVPNVQFLILKLTKDPGIVSVSSQQEEAKPSKFENPNANSEVNGNLVAPAATTGIRRRVLRDLMQRLNDYSDHKFSSSQRRFLMEEVNAVAPGETLFSTLAAERLASEYLEESPQIPTDNKLERAPRTKLWRLASINRTVVALFKEDNLRLQLQALLNSIALPDVSVALRPPGEVVASSTPVPPQEACEYLPGWRLTLSFKGSDPFAAASERQSRFYLWTGFLVVVIIGMVALLVARYVAGQMRLARLKSDLVSTVSHELKTPLAAMRALVDTLIARRYRGEGQLQNYLEMLAKENLRLSHLIENFLSFSRMEQGKRRFQFQDVKPELVIRDALAVLHDRLHAPNCRIEVEVAPDLPVVRADPEALTTVLINLLENAYKYTEKNKQIALRAFRQNGDVAFEVTDNGIGMTHRETQKVFDRFYQVDQSLTRRTGGCGLGLSIVQFIVKAHQGSVDVTSEPGRGSTFAVRFPIEPKYHDTRTHSDH